MPTKPTITHPKTKAIWLFSLCVMLWIMVVIGGLTRLTESGLSMTDWKPVTGWFPPLSHETWMEEFNRYRAYPEYQKINKGMSLAEFKNIFWLEYIHRVWGRLMALALLIPMLWMGIKGWLTKREMLLFASFFVLGGMQGLIGWVMVQSGMIDRPDVSPYKLTIHLMMAMVLFSLLFLTALRYYFFGKARPSSPPSLWPLSLSLTALILIQIGFGGMMAGTNAGYIYNTWPLMDGRFLPLHLDGLIANVQMVHRSLAILVLCLSGYIWMKVCNEAPTLIKTLCASIGVLMLIQFALGVFTLLSVVDISLASAHQAVAVWVLAASLALNFMTYRTKNEKQRVSYAV